MPIFDEEDASGEWTYHVMKLDKDDAAGDVTITTKPTDDSLVAAYNVYITSEVYCFVSNSPLY